MATTVQVLCLNGHRQTVKITNNTTMLQVLEDVCKKQGFLPSSDYNLQHGRRTLDLALPFRFCNLPNNVKLEIVKAEQAREITSICLALSVPSGERFEQDFQSSASLWAVLQHWDNKLGRPFASHFARIDTSTTPHLHPVIVSMGEEVVGMYALQRTTLHHLGLLSGRALIRLAYRPVEDSALATIRTIIDQRVKRETQSHPTAKRSSVTTARSITTSQSVLSANAPPPLTEPEPMDTQSYTMPLDDSAVDVTGVQTGMSLAPLRSSSDFSMHVIPDPRTGNTSNLKDKQTHNQHHQKSTQVYPSHTSATPQPKPFTNFKFPEETKGHDLYKNEQADFNVQEYQACNRETVVYRQEDVAASSEDITLPDDFFNITETDLRIMMADQKRQVQLLDSQPLMTKSMRLLDEEQKKDKYLFAFIRIYFPDNYVLQGKFNKRENVYALHKFVRNHLQDPKQDFYLYTTPPKTVLDDFSLTLIHANLVPAAKIYFGCKKQQRHYLSAKALSDISSHNTAQCVANLSNISIAQGRDGAKTSSGTSHIQSQSATSTSSQKPKKDAVPKVPKWFTSGKK